MAKYKIQTNVSGTRHIDVSEENLLTIEKYALLDGLIASNGIVDEIELEKLRHNVRSYIERNNDCQELISLCQEILYHNNMKAYGLRELIMLYVNWMEEHKENENEHAAEQGE